MSTPETTESAPAAVQAEPTTQETHTAAVAQAPSKPLEGQAAAVAMVEAMRAEKAKAAQTAKPETPVVDESEPAAVVEAAEAGPEPVADEEAKAAAALLAAARENRAIIEQRKRLAARETELAEKEKRLSTATPAEREAVERLSKARASGDPLELLRAVGMKDADLSQFVLDAIERMGQEPEEDPKKPSRAPTAEEVAALVQQKQEEAARARAEQESQQQAQFVEKQRNAYFGQIAAEFKTNAKAYQVLAAIGPTYEQLESEYLSHFKQTGERLKPGELLSKLEKQFGGRGLTVAQKKAAQSAPTATSKTISPKATSDAGAMAVPEDEPKKGGSMYDLHEEGKRKALAAIEANRAAKRASRAMR